MYKRLQKLISVKEAKNVCLSCYASKAKSEFDNDIKNIIAGKDNRFLVIVGPCSADNYKAVLAFFDRIHKVREKVSSKILIVPRIYTAKPRSEVGKYRGMIHSVDGNDNMNLGIIESRKLMVEVAERYGLFAADEMLYPSLLPYFEDLVSYVTVGARSSESQLHRMMSSGLDIAVGIKNAMHGHLKNLAQAVEIAVSPNRFELNGYEVITSGNKYAHAILRGYNNFHGEMLPNYLPEYVFEYLSHVSDGCRSVIIDCNHFNSGKDCFRQSYVANEVVSNLSQYNGAVKGLMIESYLEDGHQDSPIVFGKSITDSCLGIEKTEKMIYDIAEKL